MSLNLSPNGTDLNCPVVALVFMIAALYHYQQNPIKEYPFPHYAT